MRGAVFANVWTPVGSSPLLETYDVVMPAGPKWYWTNFVEIHGSHVPRAIFHSRLNARWGMHMRMVRQYGQQYNRTAPAWTQTRFWFEHDEDYLLLRLSGMFEGIRQDDSRLPILIKHEHRLPKQLTLFDLEPDFADED